MNTTASFSSEPSWSRRCSTETIFSIQGKETDFVRDTSDTEWSGSDGGAAVEYEPATEPEDNGPLTGDSSGHSDNEIITTKVIEVSVGDDGELQLADSELTASSSDSEIDLHDYWLCAHCRAKNNNPLYRYCEKCFKERKNFFPPRPKRKRKRLRSTRIEPETLPRTFSQDSGVESAANSQELSQNDFAQCSQNTLTNIPENSLMKTNFKRRADTVDRYSKQIKTECTDTESETDSDICGTVNIKGGNVRSSVKTVIPDRDSVKDIWARSADVRPILNTVSDSESNIKSVLKNDANARQLGKIVSDTESGQVSIRSDPLIDDVPVAPLVKMISDPALTIEEPADMRLTKKAIINTLKEKLDIDTKDSMCIVCLVEPKSGVFVHGRIAHICCCYKCAVKVWSQAKRCPVCNCKVSNVLKAIVM